MSSDNLKENVKCVKRYLRSIEKDARNTDIYKTTYESLCNIPFVQALIRENRKLKKKNRKLEKRMLSILLNQFDVKQESDPEVEIFENPENKENIVYEIEEVEEVEEEEVEEEEVEEEEVEEEEEEEVVEEEEVEEEVEEEEVEEEEVEEEE